jgi:hypothetical protein
VLQILARAAALPPHPDLAEVCDLAFAFVLSVALVIQNSIISAFKS